MRLVLVAGEISGDILGAGLMAAIKQLVQSHCPDQDIEFVGIGGERMQAQGLHSLFAMERLSVMGLVEPLKRLPELLHMRQSVKSYCKTHKVDAFIGIDAPDFNLNIEKYCRRQSIKTLHYVSPSVWAWRQGRIKGIKKAVDHMLTLLPFEADFYQRHKVPVTFVGHPLADDIAMVTDTDAARKALKLQPYEKHTLLALMPGSRAGEVRLLGELFLQVAEQLQSSLKNCIFLIPAANDERYQQLTSMIDELSPGIDIRIFKNSSHTVMAASDAILLASGTTALEAMLFKKPMVVAYKMAPFSYAIISRLVKSKYVSLPNLLADEPLVPELLQDQANLTGLTEAMLTLTKNEDARQQQISAFYTLHESLHCNASITAAHAVLTLIGLIKSD